MKKPYRSMKKRNSEPDVNSVASNDKKYEVMESVFKFCKLGCTLKEISKLKGMPSYRTILRYSKDPEFKERYEESQKDHHLEERNGLYYLRVMVDQGGKKVGKRERISLHTRDKKEARKNRDVLLRFLISK